MASNLYEYYQEQGKALPSVAERQDIATKAGITGYVGDDKQNESLLGYLKNVPNQGGNNVMTAESLAPERKVEIRPPATDTSSAGMNGSIASLLETTKANLTKDEAELEKQQKEYARKLKESGDQGDFTEKVIRDQGVDTVRRVRDTFLSQIEQEQKSQIDQIDELRRTFKGTTGGLNAEISRIQRESANKLANLGIGLSASSRDYESAANIADRLITSNTEKVKADLESRKFVLEQLGTKIANQKAQSFQLQVKQIDREEQIMKDAIKFATDGAKDGTIDGNTAFQAVQDLMNGKISASEYYSQLGGDTNTLGNINGYDITTYATDPKHEVKVQSIYDTMGDVSDKESATSTIKSLSPDSPITGEMVIDAAEKYKVDPKLMIAIMQQDSSLGTAGIGARNNNPGNIGQSDDLGTTPVDGYETLEQGVEAVAKWLSKNKSKGVYRGEFESTLETIAYATSEPEVTKKKNLQNLKKDIADGDYAAAYKKIENTVSRVLTGENKTLYDSKRIAVPAILELTQALKAYNDGGGKTGLLKGTYEDIANKLGRVSDPKYAALATDLKLAFQKYRQDLSGAAFGKQESADYASVNPSGKNKLDLNLSILEGMYSNFKRQIDTTVDTYAGDGAQYIREYAENGTGPISMKVVPSNIATPIGNDFNINLDDLDTAGSTSMTQ